MKRIVLCLVVVLLSVSCSKVDTSTVDTSTVDTSIVDATDVPSKTPLPSIMPAQIMHENFFSDPEDGPNTDEVVAYCRKLIEEQEKVWNDLTDGFENSMLADPDYYYSFEYEDYYNHGKSYLFQNGIVDGKLVHEAVTNDTELGGMFYDYLMQYGEIPFLSVWTYEGKNPITGYWLRAFNPNTKPIHVWFVRGSMCDVMYIEKAYLSSIKDINWSIHIEPINRDWFIYWRVSASVSEGRFETTEKEGVKE